MATRVMPIQPELFLGLQVHHKGWGSHSKKKKQKSQRKVTGGHYNYLIIEFIIAYRGSNILQ
jgi:hypothetical protein